MSTMLRLVVLLMFVSVVIAQTKYCCTPDQWEGYINEAQGSAQNGTGHIANGTVSISYDYTDTKMAFTSDLTVDGQMQVITVIQNYQTKMMYTIIGSKCTPSQLTGQMMKYCVPDNAISTGKIYYGQSGDMLIVDSYVIPVSQDAMIYVTTTTSNPCVPVAEAMYGQSSHGARTVQGMTYHNITDGIKDPSVFTPPASCSGKMPVKIAPATDHHLINFMNKKLKSD